MASCALYLIFISYFWIFLVSPLAAAVALVIWKFDRARPCSDIVAIFLDEPIWNCVPRLLLQWNRFKETPWSIQKYLIIINMIGIIHMKSYFNLFPFVLNHDTFKLVCSSYFLYQAKISNSIYCPLPSLICPLEDNILILKYWGGHPKRLLCDPYVSISPLHSTFKIFPRAQFFNGAHCAQGFTELGLTSDFHG